MRHVVLVALLAGCASGAAPQQGAVPAQDAALRTTLVHVEGMT